MAEEGKELVKECYGKITKYKHIDFGYIIFHVNIYSKLGPKDEFGSHHSHLCWYSTALGGDELWADHGVLVEP